MKVSDAMLLGMSMFRLTPEAWSCGDGGCLLGVAAMADGLLHAEGIGRPEIGKHWPWLTKKFDVPAIARPKMDWGTDDALRIISYLAHNVKDRQVKLEDVIEWVRSVEPEEPIQTPEFIANTTIEVLV